MTWTWMWIEWILLVHFETQNIIVSDTGSDSIVKLITLISWRNAIDNAIETNLATTSFELLILRHLNLIYLSIYLTVSTFLRFFSRENLDIFKVLSQVPDENIIHRLPERNEGKWKFLREVEASCIKDSYCNFCFPALRITRAFRILPFLRFLLAHKHDKRKSWKIENVNERKNVLLS